MKDLIFYLFIFVLVYLFYLIFVLNRKSVLKKLPDSKNMAYLKYKYGLKINEKNVKKIANKVFLANSIILTVTLYVVCSIESFIVGILLSPIVLILLIIVLYHLIGTYYKKKQGGK